MEKKKHFKLGMARIDPNKLPYCVVDKPGKGLLYAEKTCPIKPTCGFYYYGGDLSDET